MSHHDADLQRAVDATSFALDTGVAADLCSYLRAELSKRGVQTTDDDWVRRTVAGIRSDPDHLVDGVPRDFVPRQLRTTRSQAPGDRG